MSGCNHLAERLRALLAERDIAPGGRLPPERQLATELGVSRASLREALRRLIDLGIVQSRQGSGTYLAPVDLVDLLGARLQLEPYAARLAARRRTAEDLARLDDALAELRATYDDTAAFGAADVRLHRAVTDAAHSPTVRVLLDAIADLLRHSRNTTAPEATIRTATLAQLDRLVQAIRAGDAHGAERAMREHLDAVGAALDRTGGR
ncbi:MAG TPA: FCD domain-containing protein [Conexibacter sp.]|jgi:GntR family transcriptional repressor for pyruvate dehydrogenase complex|nr:FCD domain-containing protein [Conexibacter sp.]